MEKTDVITGMTYLYGGLIMNENILKTEKIQTFLKLNNTFDLIIVEYFYTSFYLSLGILLKAPVIFVSACPLPPWSSDFIKNPSDPEYIPYPFENDMKIMNFWHRFRNTVLYLISKIICHFIFMSKNQKLSNYYLGVVHPQRELVKNISLLLINSHFSYQAARPLIPAVIEVSGTHIRRATNLPQVRNILSFINNIFRIKYYPITFFFFNSTEKYFL